MGKKLDRFTLSLLARALHFRHKRKRILKNHRSSKKKLLAGTKKKCAFILTKTVNCLQHNPIWRTRRK